jgi:hypothetical protein
MGMVIMVHIPIRVCFVIRLNKLYSPGTVTHYHLPVDSGYLFNERGLKVKTCSGFDQDIRPTKFSELARSGFIGVWIGPGRDKNNDVGRIRGDPPDKNSERLYCNYYLHPGRFFGDKRGCRTKL